jgi:hypothetical protein
MSYPIQKWRCCLLLFAAVAAHYCSLLTVVAAVTAVTADSVFTVTAPATLLLTSPSAFEQQIHNQRGEQCPRCSA